MIIGHYAASFAAKSVEKRIPLWVLFLAAQALDLVWSVLVLVGIEKVRIVPGITASSPFDLYYYPYSHSLLASLLWMAVAVIGYRVLRPGAGSWRAAGIVGLAVFSHWVLDLLVNRPDLPLYDDAQKVGLGLWNYPLPAFLVEAGLLAGGIWLYVRATGPVGSIGKYAILVFGALLLIFQAGSAFGPPPPSPQAAAATGLVSYTVLALGAYWLDRKRG